MYRAISLTVYARERHEPLGFISLHVGCENETCLREIALGRPIHVTPAGVGVTLSPNHFASIEDAVTALEQLP